MKDENRLKDYIEVSAHTNSEVQIITLKGILVYQNVQMVKEKINEIFFKAENYILDLTETAKIDSTGFGLIINIYKRIPETGELMAVVADPFIRELFSITKIDRIIKVLSSVEEGLKIIKEKGTI